VLIKKKIIVATIVGIVLVGTLLYIFLSTPSVTSSPYVIEYPTKATAYPNAITVDSSGRVWFSLWNEASLGVFFPSNETIRTFHLPLPSNSTLQTWGVVVDDNRGVVWLTDATSNAIWKFNISTREFTEYSVPTIGSFPYQLALDKQGNVWFSESFAGKLGEIDAHGAIKEYTVPQNGSNVDPTGLVIDKNGTIWFTEPNSNMIGSFSEGSFTLLNMTGEIYSPVGITIDSQGNLWVTEHTYPGLIAEYDPATHGIKTISTSYSPVFGTSLPYFIYSDSQGNLWFNEHYGNAIARYNPASGELTEFYVLLEHPMPQTGNISGILTMALSQNGTPWFTELFTGNIGTIKTNVPLKSEILTNLGEQELNLSSHANATLSVSIQGEGESSLSAYIGNLSSHLVFSFSPANGSGNFSSILTVEDNGTNPGNYFVTISDKASLLTQSQVIEIIVH
jgi:virginiamycin B lyase